MENTIETIVFTPLKNSFKWDTILYQRRFETALRRGAIVQTVTGNLVEVSSAERIEIFNGVNLRGYKPSNN